MRKIAVLVTVLWGCIDSNERSDEIESPDVYDGSAEQIGNRCGKLLGRVKQADVAGVTRVLMPWNDGWMYESDDVQTFNADLVFVGNVQTLDGALGSAQYKVTDGGFAECRWREQTDPTCSMLGCGGGAVDDADCLTSGQGCTCAGTPCDN